MPFRPIHHAAVQVSEIWAGDFAELAVECKTFSDNGTHYISLLTSAQKVARRIPACLPQYSGAAEGGMREFKIVSHNVRERRKREDANEEKELLERVGPTVDTTASLLNQGIQRPPLAAVTPAIVHYCRRREARQTDITQYRNTQESRRDIPPWNRSYREILSSGGAGKHRVGRSVPHKAGVLLPQTPAQDQSTKPGVCGVISMQFRPIYLAPVQLRGYR